MKAKLVTSIAHEEDGWYRTRFSWENWDSYSNGVAICGRVELYHLERPTLKLARKDEKRLKAWWKRRPR